VFSPDPGLQRAVKRARRRADGLYRSRTRRLLPWLMVLLALGGCGFYYQDVWARAGPSAAKSARAMFINPETANEWLLEDAAGVAGMGSLEGTRSGRGDGGMELRPSTIVLKSSKVGVVFRAVQPRMLDSWSLQLQITKGDPKVLVFAEPFGIRLDASESRVSVEWVRVQCSGTLESVRVSALSAPYRQELSPLKGTEAHGPIEIDFSIVGKRAKIRVGNGPALTLKVPARAACARCGAMLIPPLTSSEVIVSHWSQQ
jgi:hypothetical protein